MELSETATIIVPVFSLALRVSRIVGAIFALYVLATGIYNTYFHPLRKFPGPWLYRAYRLPYVVLGMRGRLPFAVRDWHARYGPVVRIAPDELAFENEDAWKAIYGFQKQKISLEKDEYFGSPAFPGAYLSMGSVKNELHGQYRGLYAHAFSAQAVQSQEPLIRKTIDLLMLRLHEESSLGKPVNVLQWLMWTTFDVVGDLAFGESFNCLRDRAWHPWPSVAIGAFEAGMMIVNLSRYFPLKLALALIPASLLKKRQTQIQWVQDKVRARLAKGTDARPDFLSFIMRHAGDDNDPKGELATPEAIQPNAILIVLGGGHTTSALLAGTLFYLLRSEDKLRRLEKEIRETFDSPDQVNFANVSQLPYLLAVLREALRIYSPVGIGIPRKTLREGMVIGGHFVPGQTRVSVYHYAASHSPRNFHRPDDFVPERWLPPHPVENNEAYINDRHQASQPFALGPRSCLGRNVAFVEMRLILTLLILNFDLSLANPKENWADQKLHITWKETPLWLNIVPRKSSL